MIIGNLKSNVSDVMYITRDEMKREKVRNKDEDDYISIDFIRSTKEEKEENFTLYALDILKPKIISRLPKIVNVKYGQKLTLVCLTTVLFPVEVEWYLNNKLLKECSDGLVYFSNKKREVSFTHVTKEYAGTIRCVAKNHFGIDESKGKIVVSCCDT